MTELGFAWMPRRATEGVALAQAVEEGGFWGLGISDSPFLYADLYPVISACLARTERISVGANVVNPVSRHWTVHSASARAYDELHPGRFHLCVGSGDGSVNSVGLRPATLAALERDVTSMGEAMPAGGTIRLAASGPRAAEVAGRVADGMIIGTGLDVDAVRSLGGRARQARRDAGIEAPFETWAQIPLLIVDDADDVGEARRSIEHLAVSYGRFAFASTFEGKAVPDHLQEPLRAGFARYRFEHHASVGGDNPNATVFDEAPEALAYLVDRMTLVDTAAGCLDRLGTFIEATGVDGVNLVVILADPLATVRRAASALRDLL